MKKLSIALITLPLLLAIVFILGPERSQLPDDQLIEHEMGSMNYYIPRSYFVVKDNLEEKDNVIFLTAMYPEFSPMLERYEDLKKSGDLYKKINILIEYVPTPPKTTEILDWKIAANRATVDDGYEYGLSKKSQNPDTFDPSWKDIYIENKDPENVSYIECTHKLLDISIPSCSHSFWLHEGKLSFLYEIRYRRKLLPHWKEIKNTVLNVFVNFKNPQHAKEFYRKAIFEAEHER